MPTVTFVEKFVSQLMDQNGELRRWCHSFQQLDGSSSRLAINATMISLVSELDTAANGETLQSLQPTRAFYRIQLAIVLMQYYWLPLGRLSIPKAKERHTPSFSAKELNRVRLYSFRGRTLSTTVKK